MGVLRSVIRRFGDGGPLHSSKGSSSTRPLASKFKSLGIDADDLDVIVQVVKHRARVAAGAEVIRLGDSATHSTLLLEGMACSYKTNEDGGRHILSFQHPGDFCDLYRYVLPERDS